MQSVGSLQHLHPLGVFSLCPLTASLVPLSPHQTWASPSNLRLGSLRGRGCPGNASYQGQCFTTPRTIHFLEHTPIFMDKETEAQLSCPGLAGEQQGHNLNSVLLGSESRILTISLGIGMKRGEGRRSRGAEVASCYQVDFLRAIGSCGGRVSSGGRLGIRSPGSVGAGERPERWEGRWRG